MKKLVVEQSELADLCKLCYNAGENNGMKMALKRDDLINAEDYFNTRILDVATFIEMYE